MSSNLLNILKKLLALLGLEVRRFGVGALEASPTLRREIYRQSGGVLHIGGHTGQEADLYASTGADVLWVEAWEETFTRLCDSILPYRNQRAILALLGDEEKDVKFFHADNDGLSSSVYELADGHGFQAQMTSSTVLPMRRLDKILSLNESLQYPHWVVDVQGAELPVLVGAGNLLDNCQTLDVEVSTYLTYQGGTQFEALDAYLQSRGFVALWRLGKNLHGNVIYVRTRRAVGT